MIRRPRRRGNAVVVALYVNAAVLLAVLVAMLSRGGPSISVLPRAFGAEGGQPIAGGGSLYLMPGQMSLNKFGCYVMDTDAQTLCVYEYYAGDKALRLVAARNFRHDRRLGNFNTDPDPRDVEKWVEVERNRGKAPAPTDRAREGAREVAPDGP
jgi:hypothetical protein